LASAEHGLLDLSAAPETVGPYRTHFADRLATTTLERHLSAITEAHRLAARPKSPRHSGRPA
jgi:hypothetical protein